MELKPCAHCGSKDVRLCRSLADYSASWYVECISCGIRTMKYPEDCNIEDEYSHVSAATAEAIDCAVDSWNARA